MNNNTDYSINFTQIFTSLMKERKITQSALGKIIGVSNQAISAYCTGKILPEYKTLLKIASYFNVSTDYLLTGKRFENKSVREELKLSENAIENLKSIAKEFNGTFLALDTLLADEEFFTALNKAVSECISNKIKCEDFSSEIRDKIGGILSKGLYSMLITSYIHASINEPSSILQNYFLSFFERYKNNIDKLTDKQKQLVQQPYYEKIEKEANQENHEHINLLPFNLTTDEKTK